MAKVTGVFRTVEAAEQALELLQQRGFPDQDIAMRAERPPGDKPGEFPDNYDPLGGSRLAGRTAWTLAATGHTMVGNSVTMDTSETSMAGILEAMAGREQRDPDGGTPARIVATLQAGDRTKEAMQILRDAGAKGVRKEPGS